MRIGIRFTALLLVASVCGFARADRVVLAPSGRIVSPGDVRAQGLWLGSAGGVHAFWLNVGVPKDDLGLELEFARESNGCCSRNVASLHYSVISEAFTNNLAPALSVGVHDALNSGSLGRAAYVSLSKTFGLSRSQEKLLGDLRLHAGYGSHGMGGAYIGASCQVAKAFVVSAETYRRRVNALLRVPLSPAVALDAATLDGQTYYGATISITR